MTAAALDEIGERLDQVALELDQLDAALAQLNNYPTGDRPAAPSREETPT